MNDIIGAGRYDADFVAGETVGFDDLRERAAQYTLDRVAGTTGVPVEDIRTAAHMMSGGGPDGPAS